MPHQLLFVLQHEQSCSSSTGIITIGQVVHIERPGNGNVNRLKG